MPRIQNSKKPKKTKKTQKKATNLVAVKPKSKSNTLTPAKKQELKKLITAYQQVGISLTKLLKN